jgi:Protein of unknown function (DUF1275)
MASLYSTKVTASGGRHGSIREDGLLDLKLALPRARSGRGDATNPEQLFAGGYAACFENARLYVSRDAGHRFADDDIDVVAGIGLNESLAAPNARAGAGPPPSRRAEPDCPRSAASHSPASEAALMGDLNTMRSRNDPEGPVRLVSAPSVDNWRTVQVLLILLSVTAGSVDAIGFLGLGGLFIAHITGNPSF